MESSSLPTHRMVNGQQVPLTQEEIQEQLLAWEQGLIKVQQRIAQEEAQRQLEQDRIAALDAFIAAQNNP